jgi:two-component system cell cycle response regulator
MIIQNALVVDNSKTTQTITVKLLEEMGIGYQIADSKEVVWSKIKDSQQPFDIVLVSRMTLGQDLHTFVSQLRALRGYASIPLILMINDKGSDQNIERMYSIGFTQVFSRKEYHLIKGYLTQIKKRDTFQEARQNKVIIIEDDLSQQLIVQSILEERFCQCFCFTSAEDALAECENIQPQVIICDFFLDGEMTALDFILKVKNDGHPWELVPILVMTGLDDETRKYELVRSGANDYISKPTDSLDLTVRVENLIRYKHLIDTVEQQKHAMHELAMHDQLTGLYNRNFIAEQVQICIADAQRHNSHYSIILLDIDHFKRVNDLNGHDVGDQVLREVGNLLRQHARGDDVAARMGGEEFIILLNKCDLLRAGQKAEYLRQKIEALKPAGIGVTASFGVAELSDNVDNFDKLFKAADIAVYSAKSKGRNCIELAPVKYQQANVN